MGEPLLVGVGLKPCLLASAYLVWCGVYREAVSCFYLANGQDSAPVKRGVPAGADVGAMMLFRGILVYEQSAAAVLLEERRGGGTGALCPAPFPITHSWHYGDQGGVYSETSLRESVFIVLEY